MNHEMPLHQITVPQRHSHRVFLDAILLVFIVLLMSVSLLVLYSAAGLDKMLEQALRFGIGFLVLFISLLIPRAFIRFFSPGFYLLTLLLLLAVYLFGVNINGSQRWLDIGAVNIQPSEIAKISIPMMLAYYYYDKPLPPSWKDIGMTLLIIFIPVVLIFKQPDLGTSLLVALSGLIVLFLAGISWRLIVLATVFTGAAAAAMWYRGLIEDYQKERVLTFLNPESDPTGSGYNIIQSKIAIGSGGMHGKGYLNGTQSAEFLPERTTDFIFAVFSEEFGLIGIIALFILFFLVLIRGLWLSVKMTDNYSRLLSGALIFIFFIYFFINVGMVSGIIPVVGLPLPLISYGGTSIMTVMLGFGLMMNLYGNRRRTWKGGAEND